MKNNLLILFILVISIFFNPVLGQDNFTFDVTELEISENGNIFKWLVSFHLRVIYHTRHSLGPIKFKRSVTETNHARLCMPALAKRNISD